MKKKDILWIVLGVVTGLLLVGGIACLIWKHHKKQQPQEIQERKYTEIVLLKRAAQPLFQFYQPISRDSASFKI